MNEKSLKSSVEEVNPLMIGRSALPAALEAQDRARRLALAAVAGPVLFTLAWFVLGFLSPGYTLWDIVVTEYSPVSQPISGLGLGATAPYMNAAFVIGGILVVIGAIGIFRTIPELGKLSRRTCTVLLAHTGLGMAMSGIFTLEAIMLHTAGFVLGTGTPVLGFLVIGILLRRIPRWRRFSSWLLLGSPLTLALLALHSVTFDPVAAGAGIGFAGLAQRVLVTEVLAWIAAMGWMAFTMDQFAYALPEG